jgi:hypothetical protein
MVVADDSIHRGPSAYFERLFGDGSTAAARRWVCTIGGLLDSFSVDIARLKQRVGVPDRVRVDQYPIVFVKSSVRSSVLNARQRIPSCAI